VNCQCAASASSQPSYHSTPVVSSARASGILHGPRNFVQQRRGRTLTATDLHRQARTALSLRSTVPVCVCPWPSAPASVPLRPGARVRPSPRIAKLRHLEAFEFPVPAMLRNRRFTHRRRLRSGCSPVRHVHGVHNVHSARCEAVDQAFDGVGRGRCHAFEGYARGATSQVQESAPVHKWSSGLVRGIGIE
jgi:hypothetical protein